MFRQTSTFSNSATAAIIRNEVPILSFNFSSFFSPYRMENNAPLPMHSPSRIEVKNVISVYDDPTAARASAPRNLPTITVSAILYVCCRRFPAIKGRENNIIFFVTGPFVKSMLISLPPFPVASHPHVFILKFILNQILRIGKVFREQNPKTVIFLQKRVEFLLQKRYNN